MKNTWKPVLPYEPYHSVAQRVEADGNDGEGYTDIKKLLEAVENHYMVHKTSFHLLKREDLEPVPHPQAEPTGTTTTTATATSQGVAHATETADGSGHPAVYSLFGDGEGRGYTVRLSFDVCQSHHQESAARLPQIFDHRSMFVSHTTRNLRHSCRRFSIIDQCLSVTPPGICGTNAADF
jgi:hypothetical protein